MAKEISNFSLFSSNNTFCEKSIYDSINRLKGIDSIIISINNQKVLVEYDPSKTSSKDIAHMIEKQGYIVS